jgi:DNA repair exonuclease SbcCD ATPase subunit
MPTPSFTLTSLTLRAFRSVVDEQTIVLPKQGMHLITGPSGAGKTTLGEGIAFALGYSSISATALQSWDWLTKENLRAVLEVELPGRGFMRVTRGKGASVLMPGEEKPRTSAKGVQEGIIQALGIEPDFLKVLTYRGQKTPGLFLSMTDSGKKQFLTQLLGLGKFETAVEKSLANIGALEAQCNSMQVRYKTLEEAVGARPSYAEPKSLTALHQQVALIADERQKLIDVIEETKALDYQLSQQSAAQAERVKDEWFPKQVAAENAVRAIPPVDTKALENELAAARDTATSMGVTLRTEIAQAEKEVNATRDLYAALKVVADKKVEAERRLADLQRDYDALLAEKCFTCLRPWQADDAALTIRSVEAKATAQRKVIADAELAAAQMPALETAGKTLKEFLTTLRARDPVPAELKANIDRLVGAIASAKAERETKVANARAEHQRIAAAAARAIDAVTRMTPEEEQVRRTLSDLNAALAQVNAKLAAAKQDISFTERENEQADRFYKVECDRHDERMRCAEKAKKDCEAALAARNTEQDFLGMVRGFLSYIFDETLSRIADATNARLALIPNVSNVTLRFASERETGTGKLRQEITAVCEKNGHVIPIKDGISGGMYTAVELAVDLSLADVIAERTGVYPGWLILDEAFEGLDDPCKAACFDMLKAISVDRAVFVVDHTESMKELFDSRIAVNFDGERSTIVLS